VSVVALITIPLALAEEGTVEFGEAIGSGFRKYATFSGRASRSEFWYFQLFVVLMSLVAEVLDRPLFSSTEVFNGPLSWIITVVTLIPTLAVGSRRLHDTERTGWLQLLILTVIGIIPLVVWWASRGTLGINRFGADPLSSGSPVPSSAR